MAEMFQKASDVRQVIHPAGRRRLSTQEPKRLGLYCSSAQSSGSAGFRSISSMRGVRTICCPADNPDGVIHTSKGGRGFRLFEHDSRRVRDEWRG
jgi:hypothetical protein